MTPLSDDFDAGALDLLHRILLSTDGTLTDVLEAAFREHILLVRLDVALVRQTAAHAPLELEPGSTVMERKILLRGERTGRNYVYAESLLALDHLKADFRDALLHSAIPLGRLWLEHRLETWKEKRELFRRPALELAGFFGIPEQTDLLVRRYRVYNNGKPVILITEYFPQQF